MKRIFLLLCIVNLVNLSARGEDNGPIQNYYSLDFELYDVEKSPKAVVCSNQKQVKSATNITIPHYVPYQGKDYEVYKIDKSAFVQLKNLRNVYIEAPITEMGEDAFNTCGLPGEELIIYFRYAPPTKIEKTSFNGNSYLSVCFNAVYEKEAGLLTLSGYKTNANETAFAGLNINQFIVPENAYWYTTKHNTLMKPTHPENFLMDSVYYNYVYKQGSITLDRKLTYIPAFAFTGKGELTSFTIPQSVTEIQNGAFMDCTYLKKITMRGKYYTSGMSDTVSSITRLGDNVFMRCQSLEKIQMPNLTKLGKNTFNGCTKLTSVTFNKVAVIPSCCFKDCKTLNKLTFLGCTTIDEEAFSGCSALTTVAIPKVTEVGMKAFANCTKLQKIDNLKFTLLDNEAFLGCTALTEAKWDSLIQTGTNVLAGCTALQTINMPRLNVMGDGFARGCSQLQTAVFDSSLHTIGASAFKDCKKLTTFTAPALWSVKDSAFYNCSQLNSIDLSRIRDIRNASFAHCTCLQEIGLGREVTGIGNNAFDGCTSVRRIVCMTVVPPVLGDSAFSNINTKEITLFVPNLSVDAYRHSDWGKYNWKQIYPYYDIEVSSPLYQGDTIALVSNAEMEDFVQGRLRFYSSDDSYVSVDSNGVVIAKNITNDPPYVTITAILDGTICYRYLRFSVVTKPSPQPEPEYTILSSVQGEGKVFLPDTKIRAKQWAKCTAQAKAENFLKRIYVLADKDTVPLYQDPSDPMTFRWTMPPANVTIYAEFEPISDLELEDKNDYESDLETMLYDVKNVTLRRSFNAYRIGSICLPFDLPDLTQTPFKDAHVLQITTVQRDYVHGLLITYSEVKSMKAGYPYAIYFSKRTTNPQFDSVRITASRPTPVKYVSADSTTTVTYQGLMKPQLLQRNDSSTLFYNRNRICYPTKNMNVGAFKGYFIFDKSTWGVNNINWRMDNGFTLKEADEDDSEEDITGFVDVKSESKGVYKVLYDGNLFLLRDDKIYNAQGQRIK